MTIKGQTIVGQGALYARRQVLVGAGCAGLGSAIFPGLASAQSVTADQTPDQTPDQTAEQQAAEQQAQQTAALAAGRDEASRLMVEVRLNGGGPYRFVVDTGSEKTVLADNVAIALGLGLGDPVIVSGIARELPAQTARLSELIVGPFRHRNLRLPVLPRAYLGADGYLGLDLLTGSCVTFDFKKRELRIENGGPSNMLRRTRSDLARVNVMGRSGLLRATDCVIDGISASAFIDTGAEVSVANDALRLALLKKHPQLPDLGPFTMSGVTGGELVGRIVPIDDLTMQDIHFSNFTIVIADVPNFQAWGLVKKPAILIGIDFLRQFSSVAIDYRQKEFIFTLG